MNGPISRAIAALTVAEIEHRSNDGELIAAGNDIPLLQRSIAIDLRRIDTALGPKGGTLLFGIAEAIDEALLALAEAATNQPEEN